MPDQGPTHDLFIAYAEADRSWVEGYLIKELGLPRERVITKGDFRPGASTLDELERAVTSSRYTLLVLSPAFLVDEWAVLGENLASFLTIREQQERLIPLVLHPADLPLRIEFRVSLDCTDEARWDEEVARLRAALKQARPEEIRIPCPYPGMVPFRSDDARFFHGREDEIERMLRHLRHQRMLFVIGPSGSGKSSLIAAGLLPRLAESSLYPAGTWLVRQMRPGANPWQSLSDAIDGDPAAPAQHVEELLDASPPAQRLLLIVDQFEELFTQVERPEQGRFVDAMQALRKVESCTLLLAMRADFYPELMHCDLWPVDPSLRLEIGPLRGDALRRAIERPAQDAGVYLETRLVDELMADAADEPGVLPMLQETLVLLWDKRRRNLLPYSAYEDLRLGQQSGLAVAMANKADWVWTDLSAEQQVLARRTFLRLIQFGQGRPDTRRQQSVADLQAAGDDPELFEDALDRLVENRLLTLTGEATQAGGKKVDIAHEALISGWPRLWTWVQERRDAEEIRRRLEARAADWDLLERKAGLLDEIELREAESWLKSPDAEDLGSSNVLRDFVAASRMDVDEQERRAEEARQRDLIAARRQLRLGIGLAAAVIVMLLAAGGALLGLTRAQQAAQQRARADAQKQATEALQLLVQDPVASLRTSAEALPGFEEDRLYVPQAEYALTQALRANLQLGMHEVATEPNERQVAFGSDFVVTGGDGLHQLSYDLAEALTMTNAMSVTAVALAGPDSTIVSRSTQGIQVWQDQQMVGAYEEGINPRCAEPRPGRAEIAICSGGSVWLWSYVDDRRVRLCELPDDVSTVQWAPDGSRVLAWSLSGQMAFCTDEGGSAPILQAPYAGRITDAAWAPAGERLVTAHRDGLAIWSGAPMALESTIPLSTAAIREVAFAGDERFLAWEVPGTDVTLWALDGRELRRFPISGGQLQDVFVLPDPQLTMIPLDNGDLYLWEINTDKARSLLRGHQKRVVAWDWHEPYLATGSVDGTVRVWDLDACGLSCTSDVVLRGHGARVLDVQWHDNGQLLSYGADGSLRLWQVLDDDGNPLCHGEDSTGMLLCHSRSVSPPAAPLAGNRVVDAYWLDGGTVLLAYEDGRVARWSKESGILQVVRALPDQPISHTAWSPDGNYAFAYLYDSTGLVIDMRTGLVARRVEGPVVWSDWLGAGLVVSTEREDHLLDVEAGFDLPIPRSADGSSAITVARGHEDRLALARENGQVELWRITPDYSAANVLLRSDLGFGLVDSLAWNGDGKRLLIGGLGSDGSGKVALLDAQTGKEIWAQELTPGRGSPLAATMAAFGPADEVIAATLGTGLFVLDPKDGSEISRDFSQSQPIRGIQWVEGATWPDQPPEPGQEIPQDGGSRPILLTWGGDGTARLWHWDRDSRDLAQIWQVIDVDAPMQSPELRSFEDATIGKDHRGVLTLDYEGVPRVWEAWIDHPEELFDIIGPVLARNPGKE